MNYDITAKDRATKIRNKLGLGLSPLSDITSVAEKLGIIVFKKPLESENVSAVFFKDKKNHLILINSSRTLGHQNFSMAHELSHYFFDKEMLGAICSVNHAKNEMEELADMFAAHFLMPDDAVIELAEKRKTDEGNLDPLDIVFIQQYFNVSWYAMLIKLFKLKYIENVDKLKCIGITNLTQMLGYSTDLLKATNENYLSKVYLRNVFKAYNKDEISEQRAKEYLDDIGFKLDDILRIEDLNDGGRCHED